MVRAEGEGFYARVWPRPVPPPGPTAAAVLGVATVAAAVGWFGGRDGWAQLYVGLSAALFLLLLLGFSFGARFVPVEIVADDRVITWSGERFPVGVVADCVLRGRSLELLGPEGRVLARVDGVQPEHGRWLAVAVRASIPR